MIKRKTAKYEPIVTNLGQCGHLDTETILPVKNAC